MSNKVQLPHVFVYMHNEDENNDDVSDCDDEKNIHMSKYSQSNPFH